MTEPIGDRSTRPTTTEMLSREHQLACRVIELEGEICNLKRELATADDRGDGLDDEIKRLKHAEADLRLDLIAQLEPLVDAVSKRLSALLDRLRE